MKHRLHKTGIFLSFPRIYPCKGQYVVFDKKAGSLVNSIILPVPTRKTKGILVFPSGKSDFMSTNLCIMNNIIHTVASPLELTF